MNGILDRIKSINVKRHTLVTSLIVAEIIGILALVWYLRTPLIQRFLLTPPKAYFIESFNPNRTYLLNQSDFLKGSANPNHKVVAIIRQGKKQILTKKLVLTKDGNWTLQIPENIDPGRYILTLGYENPNKEINTKNYKLNIKSKYKNFPFITSLLNSPNKFKIENITEQFTIKNNQDIKNYFFRLMVDRQQKTIKQLEKGAISSHIAPQNLQKNKPAVSTNSAIFFMEVSGENGEPIQSGWLKYIIPDAKKVQQFEITVFIDNTQAKSIKLYDQKMSFLWGNKI